jgi:hypothetical protein
MGSTSERGGFRGNDVVRRPHPISHWDLRNSWLVVRLHRERNDLPKQNYYHCACRCWRQLLTPTCAFLWSSCRMRSARGLLSRWVVASPVVRRDLRAMRGAAAGVDGKRRFGRARHSLSPSRVTVLGVGGGCSNPMVGGGGVGNGTRRGGGWEERTTESRAQRRETTLTLSLISDSKVRSFLSSVHEPG